MNEWLVALASVLGGGTVSAIVLKVMDRDKDGATAEEMRARAKGTDVDALRGIIAELRESEARKDERIERIEARLSKVEERERHALTRAAVHEAWDQLAIAFILTHDQNFPSPPPLAVRRAAEDEGDPDE